MTISATKNVKILCFVKFLYALIFVICPSSSYRIAGVGFNTDCQLIFKPTTLLSRYYRETICWIRFTPTGKYLKRFRWTFNKILKTSFRLFSVTQSWFGTRGYVYPRQLPIHLSWKLSIRSRNTCCPCRWISFHLWLLISLSDGTTHSTIATRSWRSFYRSRRE